MSKYHPVLVALLAVLFVAGCPPAATPPAESVTNPGLTPEDRANIDAGAQKWVEGALAGDWEAVAELYHADGVIMPPHAPAASGREAIAAYFRTMPKIQTFELNKIVVDGRSDLAYVRGSYTMTMETPDGVVTDEGKYLEIRTKDKSGNWMIDVDMFSSDLPLPE